MFPYRSIQVVAFSLFSRKVTQQKLCASLLSTLMLALLWCSALPNAWATQERDAQPLSLQVQDSQLSGERYEGGARFVLVPRVELKAAFGAQSMVGESLVRGKNLLRKVQAQQFKSRREVIEEVERTYQAKVLKVSLDRNAGVYEVRILHADGRVRTIHVSAHAY